MRSSKNHPEAIWKEASNGEVPANSFWEGEVGKSHAIARGYHAGGLHIGYVGEDALIIGYDGGREKIYDYEVLTGNKSYFHWVKCKGACIPNSFTPLKGGHEADGKELYIAKTEYDDVDRIGKAGHHLIGGMNFAVGKEEKWSDDYYVFAIVNPEQK